MAENGRDIPMDAAKVAAVYAGYESLKARGEVTLLDFDDLLLHTAAAIENDVAVAEEFRDRYRCFVVDEFQDVTPLQHRVLTAWLGDRDDLTVVGDANQTIYSFTGASPRYLLDFSRRFPEATVVRLERDYRSTPQVVSLANRVIAAARGRVAGSKLHLVGQRPPVRSPRSPSIPTRSPRPPPWPRRSPTSSRPARRRRDRRVVPDQRPVGGLRGGPDRSGHRLPGTRRRGFFSRQEIRQALVALQRAAERADTEDRDLPSAVRALLEPLGLTADPPTGTKARDRWEALDALAQLVDDEVATRPGLDLPALVAELRVRADSRHPPVVQG